MRDRIVALLDPTPAKGAVSGVMSVGFSQVHTSMETSNLILGVPASNWPAYAAIATGAVAIASFVIAIPKLCDSIKQIYQWFVDFFKR